MSSLYFESNPRQPLSRSFAVGTKQSAIFSSSGMSSTLLNGNNYDISEVKFTRQNNNVSASSNMLKVAFVVIGVIAIICLMNKVYADGRAAGYAAGEAAGREAGYVVGKAAGEAAGREAGYVAGRAAGEAAGKFAGEYALYTAKAERYNAGYDAGRVAGYKSGKLDGALECIDKSQAEFNKGIKQAERNAMEAKISEYEQLAKSCYSNHLS